MYAEIIKGKILEYIRLKKIPYTGRKCVNFHCPLCDSQGMSARIIPNTAKLVCHVCGKDSPYYFNLIDVARKVDNLPNATDEEILTHLRNVLNLTVTTNKDENDIAKLLDLYSERGWCLVPCAKASPITATEKIFTGKEPIQKEWQKKQNRDKAEWFHWINSGLNIGLVCGAVSNICVLDLDFLTKEEKAELIKENTSKVRKAEIEAKKAIPTQIKAIMGETLIQETLGGFHLIYQATDLSKSSTVIEGVHIDIESDGGQVVIYPSFQTAVVEEYKEGEEVKQRIVGYAKRKWLNNLPIAKMPQELYDLLKSIKQAKSLSEEKTEDKEIEQTIQNENFKVKDFKNNRHNTMVKVGGILRKRMNILQVKDSLSVINNCFFEDPLPKNELSLIVDSLDKYITDEESVIVKTVLEFLAETDIASKTDIELAVFGNRAVGEDKVRLERALTNLLLQHKICKFGLRNYKLIKEMNWTDTITNVGKPAGFNIPYFNDYGHFSRGDILLIQGAPKVGKTHLSMNIVKRIVQQNIKPYYIYNESGGRYSKISYHIGLKDGDYFRTRCSNPDELILKKDSIYVFDWLRISDFARTADVYDRLVQKLEESNSIMFVFGQLRQDNTQFAKDLINQFVSMSAKYIYDDQQGVNTHFELEFVRDRKNSGKKWLIPTRYNEETKEIKTVEEIEAEERKIENKVEV